MLDQIVQGRGGLVPFVMSAFAERPRTGGHDAGGHARLLLGCLARASCSDCWLLPQHHKKHGETEPAQTKRKIPEGLNFAHGLFRQRSSTWPPRSTGRFLDSGPNPQDADNARFGLANARSFRADTRKQTGFQEFLDQTPGIPRARRPGIGSASTPTCWETCPRPVRRSRFVQGPPSIPTSRPPGPTSGTSVSGRKISRGPDRLRAIAGRFPQRPARNRRGMAWAEPSRGWGDRSRGQGPFRAGRLKGDPDWNDRKMLSLARPSSPADGLGPLSSRSRLSIVRHRAVA